VGPEWGGIGANHTRSKWEGTTTTLILPLLRGKVKLLRKAAHGHFKKGDKKNSAPASETHQKRQKNKKQTPSPGKIEGGAQSKMGLENGG